MIEASKGSVLTGLGIAAVPQQRRATLDVLTAEAGPCPTGGGNLADLPPPVSFTLPTPPSVNELYKNVPGRGRVKSGVYDDFIRRGVASIRSQAVGSLSGYVIAVFGVERMSRTADIDNRLKSMLDTIVQAGVIDDDRFITAIAVSWLPRANGLAHVRLLPVQPFDLSFHPSPDGASGGWFSSAPQPIEDFHREAL